jgi:hypothetical protein
MGRYINERLVQIQALLERIDAALIVRDPGTTRSAEAFDGLRRQIAYAAKARRSHVSHLLALDESIRTGGNIDLIAARLKEYLKELGIERVYDTSLSEAFDIAGDRSGDTEVVEPAVIEREEDGRVTVLRVGKAIRTARPEPESKPELVEVVSQEESVKPTEAQLQIEEPLQVHAKTELVESTAATAESEAELLGPQSRSEESLQLGERKNRRSSPRGMVVLPLAIATVLLLFFGLRSCNTSVDEPSRTPTSLPETTTTITE